MVRSTVVESLNIRQEKDCFVVSIQRHWDKGLDTLTMSVEINPITRTALDYLEALRIDERSNCSLHLSYELEIQRVISTLTMHVCK